MPIRIANVVVSPQEVVVGETVTITITAVDSTWELIKNEFENWNEIKTELSNWNSVINYH